MNWHVELAKMYFFFKMFGYLQNIHSFAVTKTNVNLKNTTNSYGKEKSIYLWQWTS